MSASSALRRPAVAAMAALWIAAAIGCNSAPEEVTRVENVPVDSVVFWPPTLRYAHYGDTLSLEMRGVKRERKCAKILKLGWDFRRDSTGAEFFTPNSEFDIPSGCKADPAGLDTVFKAQVYTLLGNKFYLETPDGRRTDSVLFVSEPATSAKPTLDTLRHRVSVGGVTTRGRLVFRDSTATHPRRTVEADSLPACDLLQTAVYDKRGDTLVVRVRTLHAGSVPGGLPACAGVHADTVEVVKNIHRFP